MATKKSELGDWLGREVEFSWQTGGDYPLDERGDPDYTRQPVGQQLTLRGILRELDTIRRDGMFLVEVVDRGKYAGGYRVPWRDITPLPFDDAEPPAFHHELLRRAAAAQQPLPDGVVDLDAE